MYILMTIHRPPVVCNFHDDDGKVQVDDYSQHIGYVNRANGMANSYSFYQKRYKWAAVSFSHHAQAK
jgi:hypothetical protein